METFTLDKFLSATREMVMFQRANDECHLLNSFLIIDSKFDFEGDYKLAKDTNEHFFSREDSKIVYPALVISINTSTLSDHTSGIYKRYCHTLEVGVIDQEIKNCTNCSPCEKRKKEEIYADAGNLLRKTLNAYGNFGLFQVIDADSNASLVYAYEPVIEAKVTKGIYLSYSKIPAETNAIKKMYREKNAEKSFVEIEVKNMMLFGKFTVVTICELCTEDEMLFSYKKYSSGDKC